MNCLFVLLNIWRISPTKMSDLAVNLRHIKDTADFTMGDQFFLRVAHSLCCDLCERRGFTGHNGWSPFDWWCCLISIRTPVKKLTSNFICSHIMHVKDKRRTYFAGYRKLLDIPVTCKFHRLAHNEFSSIEDRWTTYWFPLIHTQMDHSVFLKPSFCLRWNAAGCKPVAQLLKNFRCIFSNDWTTMLGWARAVCNICWHWHPSCFPATYSLPPNRYNPSCELTSACDEKHMVRLPWNKWEYNRYGLILSALFVTNIDYTQLETNTVRPPVTNSYDSSLWVQ
jgi:hypothetical protein